MLCWCTTVWDVSLEHHISRLSTSFHIFYKEQIGKHWLMTACRNLGISLLQKKSRHLVKNFVHTSIYEQLLSEGHIHWVESLWNLPCSLPMVTSLMQEKTFLLPNLDVLKNLWKDGCEGLVVRMGHSSLGRRNLNQEMYHRVSRIRRDPQESLIVASALPIGLRGRCLFC